MGIWQLATPKRHLGHGHQDRSLVAKQNVHSIVQSCSQVFHQPHQSNKGFLPSPPHISLSDRERNQERSQ